MKNRTVTAFGREWSHRNFYGLVRRLGDAGNTVSFCPLADGWVEGSSVDIWGRKLISEHYIGYGTTPWLAMCEAVEKLTAREAGEKMEERNGG